jgi:hypothetical protein
LHPSAEIDLLSCDEHGSPDEPGEGRPNKNRC